MKLSLISAVVFLSLTCCAQHTVLNLSSSERDTSVYLNSEFLGKTPITEFEIESKKVNTLQFAKEGGALQ